MKNIRYILYRFVTLSLLLLCFGEITAQTTPEIGGTYYIAAQTWDGKKYVERFLYLNGTSVCQPRDINQAGRWAALTPTYGEGMALKTGSKYLMRGGITSSCWGTMVIQPALTYNNPPAGSVVLKSSVTNYKYYIIAPNAGGALDGTNAPAESSYQPMTSRYTPYFRFYNVNTPLIAVQETLSDGTASTIGADYLFKKDGQLPVSGNVWSLASGIITIDETSYNNVFYTFLGFRINNSDELQQSLNTSSLTANTTVKAVFASNDLDGEQFSFISSYPQWYTNQRQYKAVYLDTEDNLLKWKTYDPQDDAFYFRAHGNLDNLTLESVSAPGMFITGATTALSGEGSRVEFNPLGSGDYNILANSQNFFAYGYDNGRAAEGVITAASGTSGSVGAWWIQHVIDKDTEASRYQSALGEEAAKEAEAARQTARNQLYNALQNITVGDDMGNVGIEDYQIAMGTYNNNTLASEDYINAIAILYESCKLPAVGTIWRAINNDSNGQIITIGKDNTLLRASRRSSLYQLWEVVEVNPENDKEVALRNVGSDTYMYCNTISSNSPTTTTDELRYVRLTTVTPGVFNIEITDRADRYIYLSTSPYGPAIIVNTAGKWRFEKATENEIAMLSSAEDSRRDLRSGLYKLINDLSAICTSHNALGYYNIASLQTAIDNAKTVYADQTRLPDEYQSGISALNNAIQAVSPVTVDPESFYIICDHAGRHAMTHLGNGAEYTDYDDTDLNHFWRMSLVRYEFEDNLPMIQHYNLESVEGENTTLNVKFILTGNNEYIVEIEGDNSWNNLYGNTTFSVHKAKIGTDHAYLPDGKNYRIRNVATGKVISRSPEFPARVAMADVDPTCSDHDQIWRIEKQQGADRYQFHNFSSGRHIEESVNPGQQLTAAFNPGTWHLEPVSDTGQYKILTTMAPDSQLLLGYDDDKTVVKPDGSDNCLWVFEEVTPAEAPEVSYQVCKILNRYETERTAGVEDYLYADTRHISHSYCVSGDKIADGYNWVIIERDSIDASGNNVLDSEGNPIRLAALRSVLTSLYINSPSTVSNVPFYFVLEKITDENTGKEFTLFRDPAAQQYLTPRTSRDELLYYTVKTHKYPQWTIHPQEGMTITETELLDRNDALRGYNAPVDNAVVRIISYNGTCLDDNYKQNILQHKGNDNKAYSQLWRLHRNNVTGLYKIENIYSGNYITNSSRAGNNIVTVADESQAGEFALSLNTKIPSVRYYNILDANLGIGLSCQNTNISTASTSTGPSATPTEWRFVYDTHTEEELTAMREKYEENANVMNNVKKYDQILETLFADRAYTTLRTDISDEDMEEALAQLPEMLSDMVVKIRDNSWQLGKVSQRNWEKTFRIKEYPVISNNNSMAGVTFVNYAFGQLNEPTGIRGHAGDIIAIMVDRDVNPDARLCIEMVSGLNRSGLQEDLKKGLNLIRIHEDCNLFIYYMIKSAENNPRYYFDKFPDIKIHIEGGELYGCIDRTRGDAMTVEGANQMWADLLADGLILNAPMCQIKHSAISFNFNSQSVVQGCPVRIGEVSDIWNDVILWSQWIMGLRDHDGNIISDYIPNLAQRWNNRWLAYERTGGFMNANGGGAQYSTGTIAGIMNFEAFATGGGLWVQAHEHGHDHQRAINTVGMTEVSNNLFSNVCSFEFGATVSRGASLPDVGDVYAKGGGWFDNNIWSQTQMFYKLYLYYHVCGHKPTFWPEVFDRLRREPLRKTASAPMPADEDYLRLALVCCEVAGEDLSEFFEAYGMFRPITPEYCLGGESQFEEFGGKYCRIIGDYGTYHVYSTDEMIENMRAKMQACGPKNSNILFIDDRIKHEPATHKWAQPGQMKYERGSQGAIGLYGNVGHWDEFTPESLANHAENYTVTEEWTTRGVVLHIEGEGAVGYKIYGPNGELLYFTSFNDFVIPSKILENYDVSDLVVAVAQADGTSVEISGDDEQLFNITTYYCGQSEGVAVAGRGRLAPELRNNDVCVVEAINGGNISDYQFGDRENLIIKSDDMHTISHLDITDKLNLYLPDNTLMERFTYSRDNVDGWNSVCLPVDVDEYDFGDDCMIYTIKASTEDDGAYVITLVRKFSVEAGEPCFVYCPEGTESWNIDKMVPGIATTTVSLPISEDGTLRLNGSFVNTAIGADKYKLNGDGTAFGRTGANGRITAFRSFIETLGDQKAPIFKLRIDNTTDAPVIERIMETDQIYDLRGIRLRAPIPGQPYILNGEVHINNY